MRVAQDGLASATEYFLDTVVENLGPGPFEARQISIRVLYTCSVERVLHSNLKHLVELLRLCGVQGEPVGAKGKDSDVLMEYGRVERLFE